MVDGVPPIVVILFITLVVVNLSTHLGLSDPVTIDCSPLRIRKGLGVHTCVVPMTVAQ